ncbi:MAG TPA: cob(I)yrinic acid a,c-diamide adenosyltransferase [bacterium]|jgi:cob(I)alamin adenosyltransferase|nr:cob(I)yrinic acid a,c-diamide adenosyltransferase [bacterium]
MAENPMTPKEIKEKGLLVIYTGEGKGKSTAAFGMVYRALGWGHKVSVIQFMKGKWKTGDRKFAEKLMETHPAFHWSTMGEGFTWESEDLNIDKAAAQAAWAKAKGLIQSGELFLLVLDEITYAINFQFIDLADVVETIKNRPTNLSMVLTGRKVPAELVEIADLVTEMKKIKHPFDQGIPAKPGVDF